MNTHLYEEIRSIEDIINENGLKKNDTIDVIDPYTKLMKKEDKILNMLNDVHKTKKEKEQSVKYFTSAPIHVIIFKTFKSITNIYNEIGAKDDIFQIVELMLMKENVIYVGISLVIFSFLLMFITL